MVLNGVAALHEIENFKKLRKACNEKLSDAEKATLDIVERDSMHAAVHQHDVHTFGEFDRLKLVELEYLYQVRGIRQVMPSAIFKEGYAGYGNSWTGSKIRLLYPQDRKRAGRQSREPFLPINKVHETTQIGAQLVALRINLITDKYELHDRLLWNVDDTTIPLELFVENTLEDYGLPLSLAPDVSKSLQQQISSHLPHIFPDPNGQPAEQSVMNEVEAEKNASKDINSAKLVRKEKDSNEFAAAKPNLTQVSSVTPEKNLTSTTNETGVQSAEHKVHNDEIPEITGPEAADARQKHTSDDAKYDEDMRITIKIDITIGQHQLVDQFEWDINNQHNDPELFGVILANEMALPMEFGVAVAHSIREQCQSYSRALFNSGYQFDGKLPQDPKLQNELSLPIDNHAFLRRPEELPLYTPVLNEVKGLSLEDDFPDQDQERRELRSRRRQGRSSRRHLHESRVNTQAGALTGLAIKDQDFKGPDLTTPYYSSILPGGVDRNLSILRMVTYREDEMYGGDKQDLVFQFHKNRKKYDSQNISQFELEMVTHGKPKWLVKLKLPKSSGTL